MKHIKLGNLLEFGIPKTVKTIQSEKDKRYAADISKGMLGYEITLVSTKGMTHYMINTKKEAKTLPKAEKIAKEWLESYVKNPR